MNSSANSNDQVHSRRCARFMRWPIRKLLNSSAEVARPRFGKTSRDSKRLISYSLRLSVEPPCLGGENGFEAITTEARRSHRGSQRECFSTFRSLSINLFRVN